MHARRASWGPNKWLVLAREACQSGLVVLDDRGRRPAEMPYSHAELIFAAETGRPVYFALPTDRLQQVHFIAVGHQPPGWEYVPVMMAVKRSDDGV